jgi:hypothetical protein
MTPEQRRKLKAKAKMHTSMREGENANAKSHLDTSVLYGSKDVIGYYCGGYPFAKPEPCPDCVLVNGCCRNAMRKDPNAERSGNMICPKRKKADNPFQHPFHHGAQMEMDGEEKDRAVRESKMIKDIMFPKAGAGTTLDTNEMKTTWDMEATAKQLGEEYAKKCKEWLDQGGLFTSAKVEYTEIEQDVLLSNWNFEKKSRDDPSNFTPEQREAWKKFFDDDLKRMKKLLYEMGMLAPEIAEEYAKSEGLPPMKPAESLKA